MPYRCFSLSLWILFALTACSSFSPYKIHTPYCDELESQIVFGGPLNGPPKPYEMTYAETPLQQESYDRECIIRW